MTALPTGPLVKDLLDDDSDLSLGPQELEDRLEVVVPENSTVLNITVRDSDRGRAQLIASKAAASMVQIINRVENAQGAEKALLRARVTTPAGAATTTADPPAWRNPVLGAAAGLLVGLGLAVVVSRLDRRVRDEATVGEVIGGPVLAVLPMPGSADGTERRSDQAWNDAVRGLRTSIYFSNPGVDGCLTLAITSAHPVAQLQQLGVALATTLADAGARVLLVDADLHERRKAQLLDEHLDHEASLATYLSGTNVEGSVIRHDVTTGVDILPAGVASLHAADLLHSPTFATVLADAAQRYDFVLVTTPAMSLGTDAAAVAARCDGTLLTVLGRTRKDQLRAARNQLERVDARVLGAVLLS